MNESIFTEIYEKVNVEISDSIKKKLRSTKVRKEMLKKYKNQSFLDSENLKFPVVNPETGKKDCKLIYAAYIRATIYASKGGSKQQPKEYYERIKTSAKNLYTREKCSNNINVKISENDDLFDIMAVGSIFEFTENDETSILENSQFIEV